MASGTSLGEGIGLQSGNRSDYWMRRLADDQRVRDAKKEQSEKELASMMDIKVPWGELYPAWGKEIQKELAVLVSSVSAMNQQNKHVSRGQIMPLMLKAQQRVGELMMSNKMAKEYVLSKDIIKDENLVAAITSTDSDFKTLQQYNRPGFITTGDRGEFSFRAVPDKMPEVKFDVNVDYVSGKPTGKTIRQGNTSYEETSMELTPNAVVRETTQLATKPDFIGRTLFTYANELQGATPEEQAAFVQMEAEKVVRAQVPKVANKWTPRTIQQPSGSGATTEFDLTIVDTVGELTGGVKDPDKTETFDASKKSNTGKIEYNIGMGDVNLSYDKVMNVPKSGEVTIAVTPAMRKINPSLKDVKAYTVKPTNIYRTVDDNGNPESLMAMGRVVEYQLTNGERVFDEAEIKRITKNDPIIPAELVAGAIHGAYKVQSVKKFEEMGFDRQGKKMGRSTKPATAKKEIKASDIAADAKAAGYTTKEYRELLIENGFTIK